MNKAFTLLRLKDAQNHVTDCLILGDKICYILKVACL